MSYYLPVHPPRSAFLEPSSSSQLWTSVGARSRLAWIWFSLFLRAQKKIARSRKKKKGRIRKTVAEQRRKLEILEHIKVIANNATTVIVPHRGRRAGSCNYLLPLSSSSYRLRKSSRRSSLVRCPVCLIVPTLGTQGPRSSRSLTGAFSIVRVTESRTLVPDSPTWTKDPSGLELSTTRVVNGRAAMVSFSCEVSWIRSNLVPLRSSRRP